MERFEWELSEEELRHGESIKWGKAPPDVLPLWVADMDFALAPSIRAALAERLRRTVGYPQVEGDPDLTGPLQKKLEGEGWSGLGRKGWVRFLPGVVPAIGAAIAGLTEPGEAVMTMTPAYPPFLEAVKDQRRELREVPLSDAGERWEIDWEAMERAALVEGRRAKVLLLCHPHNPTGRLWTVDELARISDFAHRHELWVVSDELHADLTLRGIFTAFANVAGEAVRQKTLTLTGPCKMYNTAGLGIGAMFSHDAALVARVIKPSTWTAGHPGTMAVAMWKAALRDDGKWRAEVLEYLRANGAFVERFVSERLPGVRMKPVEATYLAWLDYRAVMGEEAPRAGKMLLEQGRVMLSEGAMFGAGFEGFVRLNFATSRAILTEALERMARLHGLLRSARPPSAQQSLND
ncbi:MAG TPA: aminotransferase class I/II-fold pyridoxal phosphate-dependent enzyme [Phycisphaerae bacterium]|nr:aminotransferase class I/II-fold pyridoxal phosphate-dependent enzyme [Phycisphaerae bacterium]